MSVPALESTDSTTRAELSVASVKPAQQVTTDCGPVRWSRVDPPPLDALRSWMRARWPRLYAVVRDVTARIQIEYKVLRQIRLRYLIALVFGEREWRRALPVQRPRTFRIGTLASSAATDISAVLAAQGIAFDAGAHAVYLSPEAFATGPFAAVSAFYPKDAGLKIMRNLGGVDKASYLYGPQHSKIQNKMTHGHRHLTLVANLLYASGLGPRLYDLIEITCAGQRRVAYVVQHVNGPRLTMAECAAGIERLKDLEKADVISVITPDGFKHNDFICPSCNGNARRDAAGTFRYVDFQNFTLNRYDRHLKTTVQQAQGVTHFGDRSFLRGNRYLYQSVPGLMRPAKRKTGVRMNSLTRLIDESGCTLEGRVVLDIGCNSGMMLGQYLGAGAEWCHGWDREGVVVEANKMLLAVGCTRFTLTGCHLEPGRELENDVPDFVRDRLDGCVVSYLAVLKHLGWMNSLTRLPWSFLLYEGHEDEDETDARRHLDELHRLVKCEVAAFSVCRDGDSLPRPVAIVRRLD